MKHILLTSLLISVWLPVSTMQTDKSCFGRRAPYSYFWLCPDNGDPLEVQATDDPHLFPILVNGKVGYINVTGRVVIEPNLQMQLGEFNGFLSDERYFRNGLAIVSSRDRGGFIDKTGRFVIEGPYFPRGHFSDGLARVSDHKNYDRYDVGFMDRTGKFVIPPKFDRAEDFSEGLALVMINDKWGYIDKTGQMVIPARFVAAESFHNGFARVNHNIRSGHIDKTGKFISVPDEVDSIGPLAEGLISVRIDGKWGFMNTQGQIVITPKFDAYPEMAFVNGLAVVTLNGKVGYIDRSGQFQIPPRFDEVEPFKAELAAVSVDKKWGLINRSGEYVALPKFDHLYNFAEGLALVSVSDKWGYIDRSGKEVIPPQFSSAHHFSEGLASVRVRVREGQKDVYRWGYIDRTGKMVIEPQFISGGGFEHGLSRQLIKEFHGLPSPSPGSHNEWGYINRTGKYVWKSTGVS